MIAVQFDQNEGGIVLSLDVATKTQVLSYVEAVALRNSLASAVQEWRNTAPVTPPQYHEDES